MIKIAKPDTSERLERYINDMERRHKNSLDMSPFHIQRDTELSILKDLKEILAESQ